MLRGKWERKKRGAKDIIFDDLSPVFEAWGSSAEGVIRILEASPAAARASRRAKLLRSLISGPIDADKLDYLMRDGRHADVPYPEGVDIDRLLRCLTTIVVERVEGGATDVPTIGVHSKGKISAEFLTLARYAMFSQVYWHHAVRAQKAMLFRAVEALLGKLGKDEDIMKFRSEFYSMVTRLPESLFVAEQPGEQRILFERGAPSQDANSAQGARTVGSEMGASDAAVLVWLRERLEAQRRPEAVLISGILGREFFKRLWVVSKDMGTDAWNNLIRLWDQLGRNKRFRLGRELEREVLRRFGASGGVRDVTRLRGETAAEQLSQMTAAEEPWLLVDFPGPRVGSEIGLHYVLEGQRRAVRKEAAAVGDLRASEVWDHYAKNLRSAAGKIRVFCHPRLVDSVEASLAWEQGIDALRTILEKAVKGEL